MIRDHRRILFIQEYSLNAVGGGSVLLRKLLENAYNDIEILLVNDKRCTIATKNDDTFKFSTYPRNFRFGIGRIMGALTILGLDLYAWFSLTKIIKKFEPNKIHIIAHGVCFPVSCYISKLLNIKTYISIHDNWPNTVAPYLPKIVLEYIFMFCLKRAEVIYPISDAMNKYLKEKYNLNQPSFVVHDGFKPDEINRDYNRIFENKTLRIIYLGMVYGGQLNTINKFLYEFDNFSKQKIILGIYSNTTYTYPNKLNNIEIINYGWKDMEEIKIAAKNYDYSFLPISFHKHDELLYRTSFNTKIPTYYLLQLPIILISPAYSYSYNVIKEDSSGLICNSLDLEAMRKFFNKLESLTTKEYYALCLNQMKALNTRFNIENISKNFWDSILENVY